MNTPKLTPQYDFSVPQIFELEIFLSFLGNAPASYPEIAEKMEGIIGDALTKHPEASLRKNETYARPRADSNGKVLPHHVEVLCYIYNISFDDMLKLTAEVRESAEALSENDDTWTAELFTHIKVEVMEDRPAAQAAA